MLVNINGRNVAKWLTDKEESMSYCYSAIAIANRVVAIIIVTIVVINEVIPVVLWKVE